MQDYQASAKVSCAPERCFRALTRDIALWWTTRTDGAAEDAGAEFTVHFGRTFKTMRVAELIANRTVVWRCIDSHLDLDTLENKSEWTGTDIRWEIEASENGARLSVTHVGLNRSIGCYSACEKGWDFFFMTSLIPYLENGIGRPQTQASQST